MGMYISPKVQAKLAAKRPPVHRDEIEQCFANRTGVYLLDTREQHQTEPPTRWFIAETDYGRKLKVCFIPVVDEKGRPHVVIKSAFEPNQAEIQLYKELG